MSSDRPENHTTPLRVVFVPGVTPDKWGRLWRERMPRLPLELSPIEEEQQTAVLYDGRADMCFVRLPVAREHQDGLHVIPLYAEVLVVVAPKGHFVEAADEVTLADLADEHRHHVPPLTAKQAVETVAAGVGIVILPMSVARLHHRRDVVQRPITDVPESTVGLAWRRDLDDDRVERFIGVVRGRTAHSSRGADQQRRRRRR
jgi:DNA-binding transcriptional LysR family regulator